MPLFSPSAKSFVFHELLPSLVSQIPKDSISSSFSAAQGSTMVLTEESNSKERGANEGNQDMGDGIPECTYHPYRGRNHPGGICPFCLQDKLARLLTASSSSSFRSTSPSPEYTISYADTNNQQLYSSSSSLRWPRAPFGLSEKEKKREKVLDDHGGTVTLNRSKSTAIPIHREPYLDCNGISNSGHRKRSRASFWSVLYLNRKPKDSTKGCKSPNGSTLSSSDPKVSRSRSVGCGRRSLSSFGNCALGSMDFSGKTKGGGEAGENSRATKERVKCGGIFSAFNLTSTSSSSSSCSCCALTEKEDVNGRCSTTATAMDHGGRSMSWVWALASPRRAFTTSKNSFKEGKRVIDTVSEEGPSLSSKDNANPNLAAIPSLLRT